MAFTNKKCFYCLTNGVEKEVGTDYSIYPLDIPYVNLVFHKACLKKVSGDMATFLSDNYKSVLLAASSSKNK